MFLRGLSSGQTFLTDDGFLNHKDTTRKLSERSQNPCGGHWWLPLLETENFWVLLEFDFQPPLCLRGQTLFGSPKKCNHSIEIEVTLNSAPAMIHQVCFGHSFSPLFRLVVLVCSMKENGIIETGFQKLKKFLD